MALRAQDIPKENLFAIGRSVRPPGAASIRKGVTANVWFHFANPRRPFVFDRREALNIIGYIIALDQMQPRDIEEAAKTIRPNVFLVRTDGTRFMIVEPFVVFLVTKDEILSLIGYLIRLGRIQPSEIDACVVAVEEQAQGQTIHDVSRLIQ